MKYTFTFKQLSEPDLLGQWPGEETEDEFMAQLKELETSYIQ